MHINSMKLGILPVLLFLTLNPSVAADSPHFLTNGVGPTAAEPNDVRAIDSQRIDRLTATALQALASGELALARATLQDLVDDYPSYRLGHLLFAELHAANTSIASSLSRSHYTQEFMELLLEASSRLAHSSRLSKTTFGADAQPSDIIKLGSNIEHWIQVDLEHGTQSVFDVQNGKLVKRWEQYIGFGAGGFDKFEEGDLKTPLGVYRIDGFRDDDSLPELYGSGALTLDYPNLSDVYENRTGSGIWLHGVPRSNRTRGPLSSEGCIIMGNDYLDSLHSLLKPAATLVALSAASTIQHPNVDLDALETLFHRWQLQQSSLEVHAQNNYRSGETSFETNHRSSKLQWSDITVVVSGAGSINGEPQNLTFYFQTDNAIKALFWQRQIPGSDTWELVGDEMKQSRT